MSLVNIDEFKDDLISIIVPVYQVVKYLPKCIDSILAQTYKKIEIILVDDGSTDGSAELCDDYAKKDFRVKVIHKTNGGLVSARKAAWKEVSGNLIAYVDSDDWIDDKMLEIMHDNMLETGADIVITGHTENFPDEIYEWKNEIPDGVYEGKALVENVFSKMLYNPDTYRWSLSPACWDKLIKRELVEKHQLNVNEMIWDGEDHAFTYPTILDAKCISIIGEMPYHHRIRSDSVSQAYDEYAFERIGYLQRVLRKAYMDSGYWELLEEQFGYQMRWFLLKHMKTELGCDIYQNGEAVLPYVFPFSLVDKGSKVVIYGAGRCGQLFYRQVKNIGYCNIVGWISKDWEKYKGLVSSPELLEGVKYEKIVIAVENKSVAEEIKSELILKNVPEKRIVWVNPRMERVDM